MLTTQTNITPIKISYLFSNDKFSIYLVVNYDKKTYTIKQTGFRTSNETSFIFKDTRNDTRGLLKLMIEAQEFALSEIRKLDEADKEEGDKLLTKITF